MAAKGGLEGEVVADITTSYIDGSIGKLMYSGYRIEDLAEYALYEEVIYLLYNNRLPTKAELEELRGRIARESILPQPVLELLDTLPNETNSMAAVRTATSLLSAYDVDAENLTDKDVAQAKAFRLIGQVFTICAAWARIREDKEPIAPRTDLNLAENFVYMLTGAEPNPAAVDVLNTYCVLLAEHGMNASTFTSRVVTATGSDMHSAIVAAIGALKGPAHGGANAEAMKMFVEIGSADNVDQWFQSEIKEGGRRIMGIGHRVYKALDPRASVLKARSKVLAESSGNVEMYNVASRLEDIARADQFFIDRNLYPNVDYYSAIALATLNIDIDMFTPLFVMSRMAGWTAHIIGQMGGRLIRPKATYVGPDERDWVSIEDR